MLKTSPLLQDEATDTAGAAAAAPAAKPKTKTEVTKVTLSDGRVAEFAGKRQILKEELIDPTLIVIEGDTMQLKLGAVKHRYDFRNGETRTFNVPLSLMAEFAGHGAKQKYGDEVATTEAKPLSNDDMILAIEDLDSRIQAGEWNKERQGGGGISGASVVLQALVEWSGKSLEEVKKWVDSKVKSETKPDAPTRAAFYASFRAANTPTLPIIQRIEAEKAAKENKVDAAAMLGDLGAAA